MRGSSDPPFLGFLSPCLPFFSMPTRAFPCVLSPASVRPQGFRFATGSSLPETWLSPNLQSSAPHWRSRRFRGIGRNWLPEPSPLEAAFPRPAISQRETRGMIWRAAILAIIKAENAPPIAHVGSCGCRTDIRRLAADVCGSALKSVVCPHWQANAPHF